MQAYRLIADDLSTDIDPPLNEIHKRVVTEVVVVVMPVDNPAVK